MEERGRPSEIRRNVQEGFYSPGMLISSFVGIEKTSLDAIPNRRAGKMIKEETEFFGLTFRREYWEGEVLGPYAGWEHKFTHTILHYYPGIGTWALGEYDAGSFDDKDDEKAFSEWLRRKLEADTRREESRA